MPRTPLIFFKDDDGAVPVRDWLRELQQKQRRAFAKCVVRIRRLAELGHELRRPEADLLRDGIYELRARDGRVNYRILYFFHGRSAAILTHALTKENKVSKSDIDRALRRKAMFESDPGAHSYEEDVPNV
jgi:phage-related protein